MTDYIMAIDQGTTSSRAIIFDATGHRIATGQQEYPQHYPRDGWVEHDPEDLWRTSLSACRTALKQSGLAAESIRSIGISNQRETTLLWDRVTGKPVHRAIVWQDRRTSDYCRGLARQLEQEGRGDLIQRKTGLLPDPYFSASKIRWILDEVPGARHSAESGQLAFGTVDTWLLWNLTGGRRHFTDATNASRTMLFNIHTQQWDEELLQLFDIPAAILPEVLDSAADFGHCDSEHFGTAIPIQGMAGDQQAAAFGQCCFSPGMAKSTYGTGCFLLLNTGEEALQSQHRLLTTIGCRLDGTTYYALEGSIFMAGATMQWLRDQMRMFADVRDTSSLARAASDHNPVILVPAFTGLGAPWWDADARGAIYGLTRDTGIADIVAAALLSVCYQTRDLQEAMAADGQKPVTLRVDGGMAGNDYTMQHLADLLDCRVDRPRITETTALGAAWLAGLQCGLYDSLDEIASFWQLDRQFVPQRNDHWRDTRYARWLDAVARTRSTAFSSDSSSD
ncbi:MAG: glycerol kinase GlpK [Pseudomonadota bacterium]